MNKIVTVTMNPALDTYMSIEALKPNTKLRGDAPRTEPGGGGVNVSRALARLGTPSIAVYTCGGHTGSMYQELLSKDDGIELCPVKIEIPTRQNFIVRENDTGDLYRFGAPGDSLGAIECDAIIETIRYELDGASYLIASGSLPPGVPDDFYAEVAKIAREADAKFVLDTSGTPLSKILTSGAYLLKPNIDELEDLTGEASDDIEGQERILRKLLENYDIEVVVLSLGKEGALLVTKEGAQHLPSVSVEKKSTVGAGDSMVAGIVHALTQGKNLEESVLYGIACGSAAIMTPGTELVHKSDADELLQELLSGKHA